jgi:hypothetical protein
MERFLLEVLVPVIWGRGEGFMKIYFLLMIGERLCCSFVYSDPGRTEAKPRGATRLSTGVMPKA